LLKIYLSADSIKDHAPCRRDGWGPEALPYSHKVTNVSDLYNFSDFTNATLVTSRHFNMRRELCLFQEIVSINIARKVPSIRSMGIGLNSTISVQKRPSTFGINLETSLFFNLLNPTEVWPLHWNSLRPNLFNFKIRIYDTRWSMRGLPTPLCVPCLLKIFFALCFRWK
jgi:hypothetical protein